MSEESLIDIAQSLHDSNKNLILVYGFNGTGKTQLSVAYQELTKTQNEGNSSGVYYNSYSEDLFYWENEENNCRLLIRPSSLNQYHSLLDESNLRDKLALYRPRYDFELQFYEDISQGLKSIRFFLPNDDEDAEIDPIKISRGEERTFVWCFFLALFEVEGWMDDNQSHFFIDDPVSSMDEHNIFVTAASLMNLIDDHFQSRKIIITTHHIGIFSILADWLERGEKAQSYKEKTQLTILKRENGNVNLVSCKKDVFLYHLELIQTLNAAMDSNKLYAYHFALLRQVLENVASFLGTGRLSFVLEQIGITNPDETVRIINTLSHKRVFRYEAIDMVEDNKILFRQIFTGLMAKYNFYLPERK